MKDNIPFGGCPPLEETLFPATIGTGLDVDKVVWVCSFLVSMGHVMDLLLKATLEHHQAILGTIAGVPISAQPFTNRNASPTGPRLEPGLNDPLRIVDPVYLVARAIGNVKLAVLALAEARDAAQRGCGRGPLQ